MKRLISVIMVVCMVCITMVCSGCGKTSASKLPEQYRTPDMSFKGLNLECVTGGDRHTMVRNTMVQMDLPEFIIADQAQKGNEIESIMVTESTAEPFHETQTVAVFNVEIDSKGGDIPSGQYYIAAYFTYDTSKPEDVKMYLINYCFVDNYVVDKTTTGLFTDCYEKVKDQF
jgi:hypothetical protein